MSTTTHPALAALAAALDGADSALAPTDFVGVDAAGVIHTGLDAWARSVCADGGHTAQPALLRRLDYGDGVQLLLSDLLGAPTMAVVVAVGDVPVACISATDPRYFSADELKELDEIRRQGDDDYADLGLDLSHFYPATMSAHPQLRAIAAEPRILLTRTQAQRAPWDVVTPPPGSTTWPPVAATSLFTIATADAARPVEVIVEKDTQPSAYPGSPFSHLVIARDNMVLLLCAMLSLPA